MHLNKMPNNSPKSHLIILAITSIIFSRSMFFFFNDPEGTNLLISTVAATLLFLLSLGIYKFKPSIDRNIRLFLTILIQIITVIVLIFLLR